jgi:hypothetical protein
MASPAILKIDIIADATKALKQMGLVETKASGGLGFTKTAKTIAGAVGTGAVIKFGKDAANAAASDAEAAAGLARTLKNVTGATDDQVAANEAWISNLSKSTAIADDDLRPAMDALVRGFGNTEDAQKALALATDVSAGSGKDLVTVSEAMMKAANGSTGALSKLGIKTKDASGHALTLDQVMGNMADTFGGQASANADTAAGRMRGASIAMGELQESIGAGLLPVIAQLAPMLATMAQFVQDNATWIAPLLAGVLGLVAAIKIWSVVQGILNVVMAANPIVLVVLAVAALVAGIIIAYNKVDWFRDLVQTAMRAISTAFGWMLDAAKSVWNWLSSNWPLLLAIITGPFGLAVLAIVRHWDDIKGAAQAVWDWISNTWHTITSMLTGPFEAARDTIVGIWDGVVSTLSGIVTKIVNAIKNPINAVIRAWNGLEFTIPSIDTHIPGVGKIGGATIGFPNIPLLAQGGSVLRTGMAIVHAGEQFSGVGRSFGGTTVINVNVTHTGLGADSPQIQRGVVNALRGYVGRNGAIDVPVRTGV